MPSMSKLTELLLYTFDASNRVICAVGLQSMQYESKLYGDLLGRVLHQSMLSLLCLDLLHFGPHLHPSQSTQSIWQLPILFELGVFCHQNASGEVVGGMGTYELERVIVGGNTTIFWEYKVSF
mmetsp:Transcript_6186/g.11052  ORF Transcript_6186/g.11052 Transcript_6186/m.11052 type:complete len:123 (-) Transcript_6186:377-745(-)